MPRERSQTDTLIMYGSNYMADWKKDNHGERKQSSSFHGLEGSVDFKKAERNCGGEETVLDSDCHAGPQSTCDFKKSKIHPKKDEFYCILYINYTS